MADQNQYLRKLDLDKAARNKVSNHDVQFAIFFLLLF